jgi:hypothetical protein
MTTDAAPPVEPEPSTGLFGSTSDRIELAATIVLAIATVLTAWSAFQSTKWGGQQANNYSQAGAARVESAKADTAAGQLAQIDIAMYIDWITAVSNDVASGAIVLGSGGAYEPTPLTVSGFLYNRFRDEFRPAVDAWLATDPLNNPDAPKSPFTMVGVDGEPIYQLALAKEGETLETRAEELAQAARTANQNGDNYVLTMVLFASVLFFAGVSSKLVLARNRLIALGFGIMLLVTGSVILGTLPILV